MQQNQVAAAVPAKSHRTRNAVVLAVLTLGAAAAMAADATLPAEVSGAFTATQDNFSAMMKLVWGLLGITSAAYALIKIFRKNVGKAI